MRITAITRNLSDLDQPPHTKQIDHNNTSDRKWLAKHCFWAMRNGHSVYTAPVMETEG